MTELTIDQALQQGIEAHKAGQVKEADRLYTAILKAQPKHPDANHNMGVLAVGFGKVEQALPFFKTALEANPAKAQFWLSYIDALIKLGELAEAKAMLDQAKSKGAKGDGFDKLEQRLKGLTGRTVGKAYKVQDPPQEQLQLLSNLYSQGELQQALKQAGILVQQFPQSAILFNIQGAVLKGLGQLDASVEAYNTALAIKPDYAEAYNNMGVALKQQGKLEGAIEAHNKALAIKPDYAEAYYNIGAPLQDQGKLEEAIEAYKKALAVKPDYAEAYNNMGVAFKDQSKLEEAIEAYNKALAIKPDYADADYNMGNALQEQGNLEEAIEAYNKALAIKPDYAGAYSNMGIALQEQGKLEDAIRAYNKALAIKPDYAETYNNMGIALKDRGELEEAIGAYNKALAIKPNYAEAYSNLLFCSSSTQYHTPVQHLKLAKGYNNIVSPKFQFNHHQIHSVSALKLRIGFVSGDLHSHPVAYFLINLFKNIDKNHFEIVVFSNSNKVSDETGLLREHTAKWYYISNLPDADVAQLIYENSIDILIDLSGHTAKNRLPVFSYRPARLQMTWLGYFSTTGLNEIDYIIGDKFVLPVESKNHFSEDFALLPDSYLCFSPPEYDTPVAPTPAIENNFITFGCFNNAKKINDKVIKAWSTILKNTPGSKIYLKGKNYVSDRVNYINKCFEENGIGVNRILIDGPCSRQALFESYNKVDIALDPFPYPGGTTTSEALWMGVPTVTKKGTHFISNVGQSVSVNSGNHHLSVASIEEYIQMCTSLAEDIKKLNRDRLERRARISQSPLFDGHLFGKQFGELMRKLANA